MSAEPTEGFLYTAIGRHAMMEATLSARSLRHHMPHAKLHLTYGGCVPPDGLFDLLTETSIDQATNRYAKISCMRDTPFDRSVYVDADTFVTEPIDALFRILDRFHLGVALAPSMRPRDTVVVPDAFPVYNAGLITFRKEDATTALFATWLRLYQESGDTLDQHTFRRALYESDLRITAIPPAYNCRVKAPGVLTGKAKVIHTHGHSRWRDHKSGILRLERQVNACTRERSHVLGRTGLRIFPRRTPLRLPNVVRKVLRFAFPRRQPAAY